MVLSLRRGELFVDVLCEEARFRGYAVSEEQREAEGHRKTDRLNEGLVFAGRKGRDDG
jgi:hypothetical protein